MIVESIGVCVRAALCASQEKLTEKVWGRSLLSGIACCSNWFLAAVYCFNGDSIQLNYLAIQNERNSSRNQYEFRNK